MKKSRQMTFLLIGMAMVLCVTAWAATCGAATAVDGFLGIPWGATGDQVDKAMKEKGYNSIGTGQVPNDSSAVWQNYEGKFAGYSAKLAVMLKFNRFFQVMITIQGCDANCGFEGMYREKYGRPYREEDDQDQRFLVWAGLSSNPSEDINIKISIWKHIPSVQITYVNASLHERLKRQGKDNI